VDTSDCFERGDLEAKWSKLSDAQRAVRKSELSLRVRLTRVAQAGPFVPEDPPREETASKAAASASPFDAVAWASEALQPARLQLERLQASLTEGGRYISSGEAAAAARARLGAAWEEADTAYGLDAKARRAAQAVRDAVRKADATLGVGAWARSNGPGIWQALGEFRATPVGQVLSFAATAWLFLSGAFWTLLSWSFLALLVTNIVAPTLLRGALEDAVSAAAEQAAARGGAMPPGGFGGPGASGASPPRGPPPGPGRRRDLSGSAGPVVDVDADVVDV
jgi:hypothetical protein